MSKRKYKPIEDDFFVFAMVQNNFGLLKPIEDKLRAGGYEGPFFADFDNEIYEKQNVIDKKATQKKQEEADAKARENGEKPRKVSPAYKSSKQGYVKNKNKVSFEEGGEARITGAIEAKQILTDDSEKVFQDLVDQYDKYLDLLIKNTPKEEFPEELDELEYTKGQIRAVKVFGSREVVADQYGFLVNTRGFDADLPAVAEFGNKGTRQDVTTDRQRWRGFHKNYGYSDVAHSATDIINLACDWEENPNKDSYAEQIKFREDYKKSLLKFKAADQALQTSPEDYDRMATAKTLDSYLEDLNNEKSRQYKDFVEDEQIADYISKQPKNDEGKTVIDYKAIMERVAEQEKKGEQPDPAEAKITANIKEYVKNRRRDDPDRDEHDYFHSLHGNEVEGMGMYINKTDFSGKRGSKAYYSEIDAQINAIEMGWPTDELQHISRMQMAYRKLLKTKGKNNPGLPALKEEMRTFYEERIKDKPYPATEEERKKLYEDMYRISKKFDDNTICYNSVTYENGQDVDIEVGWTKLSEGIKASMEKKLTFAEKTVLKHDLQALDQQPEQEPAKQLGDIKANLSTKKRFGHSDSKEFIRMQKALEDAEKAAKADKLCFTEHENKALTPEALKKLTELRDSAANYLNEKDKEKKLPEQRSDMGKNRYEGAQKAYHFADKILRAHEARLEQEAAAKREIEREKGRKEMREAYLDPTTEDGKKCIDFETYKAGGKEQYEAMKAEEARKDAEAANKVPVTDEEKYDKFINDRRTKKDDPATYENAGMNKEMQQKRIDDLGNMLAAMEYKKAGKPFNAEEIVRRGSELKTIYSLNALKQGNGPEKLKDALTFPFKAEAVKNEFEQPLYEVGKLNYKNTHESQMKYQQDITELTERKRPASVSPETKNILDALDEIKSIDMTDKTLIGLNTHKMQKANLKLMNAISDTFAGTTKMDMNAYGPKLALDSLAVLSTYTGCEASANLMLQKVNAKIKDLNGDRLNLDTKNFTVNYGVEHSKKKALQMRNKPGKQAVEPNPNMSAMQLPKQKSKENGRGLA